MIPSISEYSKTLVPIPQDSFNVDLVNTSETRFPRVREYNPFAYNNHVYVEEKENSFLRPTISEYAWTSLYCFYRRKEPFIIRNSKTIFIPTDPTDGYRHTRRSFLALLDVSAADPDGYFYEPLLS